MRTLAVLSITTLIAISTGCSDVCKAGDTDCICNTQGDCTQSCPGGDCDMTAAGQGTATLDCGGGGCSLDVSAQGDTEVFCDGGNCDITVTGQGDVIIDCAGGGMQHGLQRTGHLRDPPLVHRLHLHDRRHHRDLPIGCGRGSAPARARAIRGQCPRMTPTVHHATVGPEVLRAVRPEMRSRMGRTGIFWNSQSPRIGDLPAPADPV